MIKVFKKNIKVIYILFIFNFIFIHTPIFGKTNKSNQKVFTIKIILKGKKSFKLWSVDGKKNNSLKQGSSFILKMNKKWALRFHRAVSRDEKIQLLKKYTKTLQGDQIQRNKKPARYKVYIGEKVRYFELDHYINSNKNNTFTSFNFRKKKGTTRKKRTHTTKKRSYCEKSHYKNYTRSSSSTGIQLNCKTKQTIPKLCLLCNCINESSTEPDEGIELMTRVVKSRVKNRRSSICSEIYRNKQFSWWNKGSRHKAQNVPRKHICHTVITDKLINKKIPYGQDFDHYYNPCKASPRWGGQCQSSSVRQYIGGHLFCRMRKLSTKERRKERKSIRSISSISRVTTPEKEIIQKLTPFIRMSSKYQSFKNFKIFEKNDFTPQVISLLKNSNQTSPSYITGDFNNDNALDYAVMLHNNTTIEFILALKHKQGYKIYKIQESEKYLNQKNTTYISKVFADQTKKGLKDLVQIESYSEDSFGIEATVEVYMFNGSDVIKSNLLLK